MCFNARSSRVWTTVKHNHPSAQLSAYDTQNKPPADGDASNKNALKSLSWRFRWNGVSYRDARISEAGADLTAVAEGA
tara:strand:+ start:3504 stop:3737 length:234 start_codon:yes stop_codon:yes gene_type:complete